MSHMNRRHLIASAIGMTTASAHAANSSLPAPAKSIKNRIGVSTYSFWHFDANTSKWRDIEKCLETAADMGFDGVEIL